MIRILALILVGLTVPGCGGRNTFFNDYEKYTEAVSEHSRSEARRIAAQSSSIAAAALTAEAGTEMEQALLSVIAMMQIASLEPARLDLQKPTTGFDVLQQTAGYIPFVSQTLGMYKLGQAGIKAAGNITIGEGVRMDDSLNDIEVHATGEGNAASSSNLPDNETLVQEQGE
ncbi:MAG: hypothetical protein CSB24_04635 [Deltaproteobacteria bacterium]|nr:MAG: hypothetical protein CSB24_04635 [Deltaproteobacteria bacterium]